MKTVGESLREEREKKGLSLRDIETAISIRTLYLNAIEEGNYHLIPGEVYLKGFIRNYANYLGLNGQQMVDLYRKAQLPDSLGIENSVPNKTENVTEKPSGHNRKPSKWLLISLLAICVAGSAWWLLGSSTTEEPQVNRQVQQSPSISNQNAPIQSAIPAQPVKANTVIVTAKYTDQCWTSVTVDGKSIYEGTPQAGDTITWEGKKEVTITAGNAGGIDISLNGQSAGKLGEKGEVVLKTYTIKP
ncbi:MAG: helix-turn-helix domain-containing protein [Sporomusaceae bacterium]|nr:helix-turn-helix domain-containing protein [Sporomusaceae bacterium]